MTVDIGPAATQLEADVATLNNWLTTPNGTVDVGGAQVKTLPQLATDMGAAEADVVSALATLSTDISTNIADGLTAAKAGYPIASNILRDTKHFTGLCQGQLETPMAWDAGGFGGDWGGAWYGGAAGSITVEVIPAKPSVLTARGLDPNGGPLAEMLGADRSPGVDDYHGSDVNVAVIDVSVTANSSGIGYGTFVITHAPTALYTGFHAGRFKTQSSAYGCVAAMNGAATVGGQEMGVVMAANIGPGLRFGAADAGAGWTRRHAVRVGWGGGAQTFVSLEAGASMTFAFCLPYVGVGDSGDAAVWAGFNGLWTHEDAS